MHCLRKNIAHRKTRVQTAKRVLKNHLNVLAQAALRGIHAVMNGERPVFELEYPCHAPTELRWFVMRVHALSGACPGVVIAHEEVTDRKQAEPASHKALEE